MSGIFGVLNQNDKPVNKKNINALLDAMSTWKYDDSGVWIDGSVALGHTMLWNTPESKYEHLPLHKDEYVITMDARIDNRDELAKELVLPDLPLEEIGDSEFILAAYKKWKEECPTYLIGDFAFAIWDSKNERLFCARDHLGMKSFYYHENNAQLTYASDIGVVLASENVISNPNIEAMKMFAYNGSVSSDQTMYQNIKRLPAAHYMIVENGQISHKRYWKIENITPSTMSIEEASKKFNELFSQAIKVRLRTTQHTGFGCEVSGGLDSSSVFLVAKNLKKDITPFSLLYGDYHCDESSYIDLVSEKSNIVPVTVRADKLDYKHQYNMEFNYRVNRYWPIYVTFTQEFPLAEKINDSNIKVVLTGQGGDHIMAGNTVCLTDYFLSFQWVKLYREVTYYQFDYKHTKEYFLVHLLSKRQKKILKNIYFLFNKKPVSSNKAIKNNEVNKRHYRSYAVEYDSKIMTDTGFSMFSDNNAYKVIEKEYGIEYRHPFFDIKLVEFMLSLPPEFKMKQGVIKILLREAMHGVLPEEIRKRNTKAEFSEAIEDQINAIDLNKFWSNADIVKLDIITQLELDNMLYQYKKDEASDLNLWRLINLEQWYRINFTER